jgi:hypothetical protein
MFHILLAADATRRASVTTPRPNLRLNDPKVARTRRPAPTSTRNGTSRSEPTRRNA